MYYIAIFLTVAANLLYHVSQRYTRHDVHPLSALTVTYAVALVGTVAFGALLPSPSLAQELRKVGWASYTLGGAIILLEVGFLLAYRAGWTLNTAALYSNVAVGVLLIPIGYLLLREGLSPRKGVGIALALAGLVLLSDRTSASVSTGEEATATVSESRE